MKITSAHIIIPLAFFKFLDNIVADTIDFLLLAARGSNDLYRIKRNRFKLVTKFVLILYTTHFTFFLRLSTRTPIKGERTYLQKFQQKT